MYISFVILTWNSEKYIQTCIKSYADIAENNNLKFQFIVIDNGSTDNTVGLINDSLNSLPINCDGKLICFEKNHGTTVSRNVGLRCAAGKFIVICDSDTKFLEGSIVNAINYLNNNKNVGLVAPMLCNIDGTIQLSVKKFPIITDKIKKILYIFTKINLETSDKYVDFPWFESKCVDSATAAFWIFPKHTLDTVGYLDEKIFYSPEDLDFCLRIWKSKKKVVYYPFIKILHYGQQISHKKPLSKTSLSHGYGLIYYFIKHKYCISRERLIRNLKNF